MKKLFLIQALFLVSIRCNKPEDLSLPPKTEPHLSAEQCKEQSAKMLENLCIKEHLEDVCWHLYNQSTVESNKKRYMEGIKEHQSFLCQGGDPDGDYKACKWLRDNAPAGSLEKNGYERAVKRSREFLLDTLKKEK